MTPTELAQYRLPDEDTPEYHALCKSLNDYAKACGGTIDSTRVRMRAAADFYEKLVLLLDVEIRRSHEP